MFAYRKKVKTAPTSKFECLKLGAKMIGQIFLSTEPLGISSGSCEVLSIFESQAL